MKKTLKTTLTLLLSLITIFAWSQTVIVDYMKVKPENDSKYLEVEKEWKKIHEARLEKGYITAWQLWQKMYATAEDEYQYITTTWFKDLASTDVDEFEDVFLPLYNEKSLGELMGKTGDARQHVKREVTHQLASAENSKWADYIIIGQMKLIPGMRSAYEKMEKELYKPIAVEAINREWSESWSIWYQFPMPEHNYDYVAVNGYKDLDQAFSADYQKLIETVYPDKTMEEISENITSTRKTVSTEIWKLVDSVIVSEEHE